MTAGETLKIKIAATAAMREKEEAKRHFGRVESRIAIATSPWPHAQNTYGIVFYVRTFRAAAMSTQAAGAEQGSTSGSE